MSLFLESLSKNLFSEKLSCKKNEKESLESEKSRSRSNLKGSSSRVNFEQKNLFYEGSILREFFL